LPCHDVFEILIRNGKIHRTPSLKAKRLVVFNKERYVKVKGIAGSPGKRFLKRKLFKKSGAQIINIKPLIKPNHGYSDPSKITLYAQSSSLWQWRRVNSWFRELKNYYE
jgi:hypothetical protein